MTMVELGSVFALPYSIVMGGDEKYERKYAKKQT